MKNYFTFIFLLFFSCSTVRNTVRNSAIEGRLNINLLSEEGKVNLNGLIRITNDSSFFNLYGPLGINIAKIQIIADSIKIVDIQNRKIYLSNYKELSKIVLNIFSGEYSMREEQLICALCYFIDRDNWKHINCSNIVESGREFNYNFKGSKKKEIKLDIQGNDKSYLLKMKYVPVASYKGRSFSNSKYSDFEIISIKL